MYNSTQGCALKHGHKRGATTLLHRKPTSKESHALKTFMQLNGLIPILHPDNHIQAYAASLSSPNNKTPTPSASIFKPTSTNNLAPSIAKLKAANIPVPRTYAQIHKMEPDQVDEWVNAVASEWSGLLKADTFTSVLPPQGSIKYLRGHFIFKVKPNSTGLVEKFKARLVVNGFQQIHSFCKASSRLAMQ